MRRAYSSTRVDRAPAGAAAARRADEDEDEFPLLKQNAAAKSWPTSKPVERSAPLPPPPQYNFRIGGNRQNDRVDRQPNPQNNRFAQRGPRDPNRTDGNSFRTTGHRDQDRPARNTGQDQADSGETPRFSIKKTFVDTPERTPRSFERPPRDFSDNATRTAPAERYPDRFQRPPPQAREGERPVNRGNSDYSFRTALGRSSKPATSAYVAPASFTPAPGRVARDPPKPAPRNEPTTFAPLGVSRPAPTVDEEEEIRLRRAQRAAGTDTGATAVDDQTNDQDTRRPFKSSGRFQMEEEDEDADAGVYLPTVQKESQPQRTASSRRASKDFDFDMLEAEQALNGGRQRRKKAPKPKVVEDVKPTLVIPEFMTVQQLAQTMKIKVDTLLQKLEEEGFEGARYDHMLDAETSAMFADIYGFEPIAGAEEMQDLVARPPPEDVSLLPPRPPIVTIMGHVDHGKTTILDWLRKSSVAAGEHGGITQHIGAFSVTMPGTERQITFLDTPGHEAFLDMRRRGANVTDIVVLVVAADDSVKPQTIEAIKHALEARVQLIVAINKVDKHDANIEQVKQDLTRHDIVVEDFGGEYQAIPVSGKTGQGMEELEEAIITLADVLDLRAEQDGPAEGQILESKVTNAGRIATVLIRRGVLRVGDFIVAGPTWGRVRTLRNDAGQLVQEAFPGDPVQVDGWRGSDPTAGLEVLQADNEQRAKEVIDLRHERAELAQATSAVATMNSARAQEAEARNKVLEWEAENRVNRRRRGHDEGWIEGDSSSGPKEVHFVIKADVAGSVEAIVAAVSAIGNREVHANVIHSGTGPVTESDIRMLATTGETGYAISFNQPVDGLMHNLAHAAGLGIIDQNIIYKVTDIVKEKVEAALPPSVTQRVTGEAEIGKIFDVTVKKQTIKIAGCKVTNGTISRSQQVRVIRNGETVYTGTLESLKHIKKDVTEMRKGTECGLGFKDWTGAQEGDQVQCFEEKEEARKLY